MPRGTSPNAGPWPNAEEGPIEPTRQQTGSQLTDLVLVGGGHAHVHVLKQFGMRPMPGVRLTLVTRDLETPYSGMLPGLIAGHYAHDECHVDLMRLARFAGARLIHAEAAGIDRKARRLVCRDRPPVRYDLLSIDIGSTPRPADIPGADGQAVAVKPVDAFVSDWGRLADRVARGDGPRRIVMVGGGAAGVEVALSMQDRLRRAGGAGGLPAFAVVTRGEALPGHGGATRCRLSAVLAERGIDLHAHADVIRVEERAVVTADGRRIPFDALVWATGAGAARWLADTGLALDDDGFVAVDACLRSINDEAIFAAGDVASVVGHPRPKAGVFAVRQGPPLARNLRLALTGREPRPYVPQRRFLSLIGTGDRAAVASYGPWAARGRRIWRLKEWIDRRWMRQYQELHQDLPVMAAVPSGEAETMRCGGCGAKVPADVLARVMGRLAAEGWATAPPDDAAILEPPPDGSLPVQTCDFFRAFVSDPYLFGRIAANHALGDIHAMGGTASSALAIACVPPASDAVMEDDLYQMLRGAIGVLEAAGARLVGGHSAEAAELALGFTVTGSVAADAILRKGGLRPGDRLILTKPLGTGTLLAAGMRGQARARWIERALGVMQQPSGPAASCLRAHGATACTDVTGFGLIGHLGEMVEASGVAAVLDPHAVPVLDGALETLAAGLFSTLHAANGRAGRLVDPPPDGHANPRTALLFDPQTAGGLLAGVPASHAYVCLDALRAAGMRDAATIGVVVPAGSEGPRIRLGPIEPHEIPEPRCTETC